MEGEITITRHEEIRDRAIYSHGEESPRVQRAAPLLRVNSPPLGAPTCDATGLMNGLAVSRGKGREVRKRTRSRWPLGNRDVTDRVLAEDDKRPDLCTIEDRIPVRGFKQMREKGLRRVV